MCVYPSTCYVEDERSEWVKGLVRETIKKEDIGVLLFVGYLYLNGYLYSRILCCEWVLIFDGYLYSMGTYASDFTVYCAGLVHMLFYLMHMLIISCMHTPFLGVFGALIYSPGTRDENVHANFIQ